MPQNITLLGSTGSIGQNTLDVVRRHPEKYSIFALSAYTQVDKLAAQCLEFKPLYAVIGDAQKAGVLSALLTPAGCKTEVLYGTTALEKIAAAPEVDAVMAAIVGAAGLPSALAAARVGKRILLANKEALVMAGPLFMAEVQKNGAVLLPIDSEHNAIFQSLPRNFSSNLSANEGVRAIHLTASGGPFRDLPLSSLAHVTPEQACAHPNWVMGRKISVDSATMMNKGLELIEAHFLFNLPAEQLRVVVHPQSIVHSLVEYIDGSFLAQLGSPDMRTPIAHALAYPERIESGVAPLDFEVLRTLTFMPPDLGRFPCLSLAYEALATGGNAPAILNAANEIAVSAFLAGNLPYLGIPQIIAETMQRIPVQSITNLADIEAADANARQVAIDLTKMQVFSH